MASLYQVFELIGEGSFGKVYRAKCTQTNSQVAYKVISKDGRSQAEVYALREECEIQKRLRHQNIIRMLHCFENDNEIVLITEFAHKDLCLILKEKKKLEEIAAKKIICDLVNALYYLHSNRILHRDLKPQNVLLDAESNAKLCDFGLSKVLCKDSQKVLSIKGTPLYMAPELIHQLPYDHNADLWSLGCIAYEMVTGNPPYSTKSIFQLMEMIKILPVNWPASLSESCSSLLKGLLEKNPAHRLTWPHLLYHPFIKSNVTTVFSSHHGSQLQEQTATLSSNFSAYDVCQSNQFSTYKEMLPPFETFPNEVHKKTGVFGNQLSREGSPTFLAQKEEWLDCLRKSIANVMYHGDVEELTEKHSLKLIMNTFNNYNSCSIIVLSVARLLSLPFVVEHVPDTRLSLIRKTYYSCDVMRDLLLIVKKIILGSQESELDENEEVALQQLLQLICYLVLTSYPLLQQLFKYCISLSLFKLIKILLRIRIKSDGLSIIKYTLSIFLRLYVLVPESRKFVFQAFDNCTSEFHCLFQMHGNMNVHKELCTFITVLRCTEPNYLRKSSDIELLIKDVSQLKIIAGTPSSQQSAIGTLEVLKRIERHQ